ncbi:MAG: WD40 repeat domain-containing protein, partial [Gemmataceae bacterium]
MTDKAVHLLVLCSLAMGLSRTNRLGAEGLPPRALARIGGHQLYHGPGVGCAALSPDGKRVASVANYWDANSDYVSVKDQKEYNRIIVLWDAVTGERLRELRVLDSLYGVARLTFSADGKSLAAAYASYDNTFEVAVFAVETGKLLCRMEHFKKEINAVRVSLDGKQLRVSEQRGSVSAWDAATGKQLRRWKPPPDESAVGDKKQLSAQTGILSPDGKVIVWEMGCRGVTQGARGWSVVSLRVHDAATDKLLYRKSAEPHLSLSGLAFSPDGKRSGACWENKLIVWDTATGKNQGAIEERWAYGFALTPDGRRAVVYFDPAEDSAPSEDSNRQLTLWYAETGKPARKLSLGFVDPWGDVSILG